MWDMLLDNEDLVAPSTAQQIEDATVSLLEALDLAQSLQDEIVRRPLDITRLIVSQYLYLLWFSWDHRRPHDRHEDDDHDDNKW